MGSRGVESQGPPRSTIRVGGGVGGGAVSGRRTNEGSPESREAGGGVASIALVDVESHQHCLYAHYAVNLPTTHATMFIAVTEYIRGTALGR